MAPTNDLLGTQLLGSWIICALVVLELVWAVEYYSRASALDGPFLKVLVTVILIIEIVGLLAAQANVYLYCVLHWGDLNSLTQQYWTLPLRYFTGVTTIALVQAFFILRYIKLSKNVPIGVFLSIAGLMAFGSGLAADVLSTTWNTVQDRLLLRVPLNVWLVLDVVTNILISLALIYELLSKRTELKSTQTFVHRFIILTIQSATIPAICAISALVAYRVRPDTNISALFVWIHPRAYFLSMLHMLNVRQQIREDIRINLNAPAFTIGGIHALASG